jgi:tRNA (cytidine/uridine-2'-O-)-methyltransferase
MNAAVEAPTPNGSGQRCLPGCIPGARTRTVCAVKPGASSSLFERSRLQGEAESRILKKCLPEVAARAAQPLCHASATFAAKRKELTFMLHVALVEPEIAPNTGNVGRLCVATGVPLHLIGRLGFHLDDRSVRRAGLDYWHHLTRHRHVTLGDFEKAAAGSRIICFSAHATLLYTHIHYADGDHLLFGSESRGLPPTLLRRHAGRVATIPMPSGKVRSLNLATAVGIVLYEALRQINGW